MENAYVHRNRIKIGVLGAVFGACILMHPLGAFAAVPADLCASMLTEIQSLVREIRTDCALQSRADGTDIVFNTEYRAFADNQQARSYLLYVFGSAGRMLNRGQTVPVGTVILTDDALKRQKMKFSIGAAELKRLQNAAATGALTMNNFHAELLRAGRFDRY